MSQILHFPTRTAPADRSVSAPNDRPLLGQVLLETGAICPLDLRQALALRQRHDCLLTDILLNRKMVAESDLLHALSIQWCCSVVDFDHTSPDPLLFAMLPPERWIELQAVPVRRADAKIVIATARPDQFHRIKRAPPYHLHPPEMALAQSESIHQAILDLQPKSLVVGAETRLRAAESCRNWDGRRFCRYLISIGLCALTLGVLAPNLMVGLLCVWAMVSLIGSTVMKMIAALCSIGHVSNHAAAIRNPDPPPPQFPTVSILVPLYREKEIADHLIQRLQKLTYPKELLDICLAVEADDTTTQQVITDIQLPRWLRVITVPGGTIRTKPRAMNFALNFCRGDIIGVYDAEDAPDPDQINRVVCRFHQRGSQVACLQGVLDYYNARTNWIARCFTIEYATWFRVVLPGLQKLGLILPLWGTTLFVRRNVLEQLGAWDAHNVTEDADLGIRLARHGYRTEFVETVTEEEANCRVFPWIKQRSRWLKGFAMTWMVHMRSPRLLIRQVGWWRFIGLQLLLPCALSQFLLAPLLWSLWLIPLGVAHPLIPVIGSEMATALVVLFFGAEIVNLMINLLGTASRRHWHLIAWLPSMHFYYPLGAFAAYKALYEMLKRPFYWDKTGHGIFGPTPR